MAVSRVRTQPGDILTATTDYANTAHRRAVSITSGHYPPCSSVPRIYFAAAWITGVAPARPGSAIGGTAGVSS